MSDGEIQACAKSCDVDNKEHEDTPIPKMQVLNDGFSAAFKLVDDIVLKNYVTKLPELKVLPLQDNLLSNNLNKTRLFKITKMVYAKDEASLYKFASVFNSVAATNSSIITIIDSDGAQTDFYLGIRCLSDGSTQTSGSTLVKAMNGQFPGTEIENLKIGKIRDLLNSINTNSISAVSCVANNKNKDFVDNESYLQGLEKLALAMQGCRYTAIILANPCPQEQINKVRQGYEGIYTQLSPFANTVVNYGTNTSQSESKSQTKTRSSASAQTSTETETSSETRTKNDGTVQSVTEPTLGSKIGSTIGASLSVAGAVIGSVIPGPGTAVGAIVGSAIGGLVGSAISVATNKTTTTTTGGGSEAISFSKATGNSETVTHGTSHSLATSLGLSTGESQTLQLTIQNKRLINMLDRIDKQMERLSEFESVGMWECATYFLSEDPSVTKMGASTYKALMSGENTGLEVSAINTWNKPQEIIKEGISENELIGRYICNFIHPVFNYKMNDFNIPVTPTSLVSSNELAIHMGLPRHSVWGFPVIEHSDFGKEVVKDSLNSSAETLCLGKIYNMGRVVDKSKVLLDIDSLAMHTFVVGATGSGKSNTIYTIMDELRVARGGELTYMVIEPAKGEYKRIFGYRHDVRVFGTNPAYTDLLRINPFKFPKGIHVLEHIDRLIEIFNVCWPMYAAMPAVLKDAVLKAYEASGWDLINSVNKTDNHLFPTFQDLLDELVEVLNKSAYDEEVKSNYKGSLETRVKSLTNGLNGRIFTTNEVNNKMLFDEDVIVDLSRVGSVETKSLIMGILVMRLGEYRMTHSTGMNLPLKHITVLEEAHNILKRTSAEQNPEGSNMAGKSVEMLSNAIAEMRTYGEGFIIADQSPSAVDMSAIRNTNTKIIMRLPDEEDRRLAGKSAALKDEQLDEIAKLPKGVAVVYQNDWLEPVLCKVGKFQGVEKPYIYDGKNTELALHDEDWFKSELLRLLIKGRVNEHIDIDIDRVRRELAFVNMSTKNKIIIRGLLTEYKQTEKLTIWEDRDFDDLSRLVVATLNCRNDVDDLVNEAQNYDELDIGLNNILNKEQQGASDEVKLALSQCLMKNYSEEKPEHIKIYAAWRENILKRGGLI